MKWVLDHTLNQSHYWTLDQMKESFHLRYNKESHSIRLNEPDKRLFFIERTGLFQHRMVVTTEYNMVVGEIQFQRHRSSGTISINDSRYIFQADSEKVSIMDQDKNHLLTASVEQMKELDLFEYAALLFGMGVARSQKAISY